MGRVGRVKKMERWSGFRANPSFSPSLRPSFLTPCQDAAYGLANSGMGANMRETTCRNLRKKMIWPGFL